MKSKIFLGLFLANVVLCVFSLDLKGTKWGPEKSGHGFYLSFVTERDFEFRYSGEGGGQNVIGTYIQNGNDIILTTVTINEWGELPAYIKQKNIKCSIVEANSLFSQYKLVGSNNLELWSINHVPEDGEKRMFNGNVIFVFKKKGIVNENARLREGPGMQYKFYSFSFDDEPEIFTALPKGHGVTVLCFSENTTVVDGVEMPWYYCVFSKSMWEEQFCWIWGGLVDF